MSKKSVEILENQKENARIAEENAKEAAKAVLDWALKNKDYPAFYSYCKYTNVPSYKTAEAIGMHFEKEYPDEDNKITHVSVIKRNEIKR